MRLIQKTGVLFVLALIFSSLSNAQGMRGGLNQRQGPRFYDKNTVTTITGEVVSVETLQPRRQGIGGLISLKVKTSSGVIAVHLGPSWYLDNNSFKVEKGDNITITGSRVTFNGQSIIVASEVKNGKKSLKLRNEEGFPVWSRRGE